MSCRAPAGVLDPLLETWPAGQPLHVVHDSAYAPESFNPGVDATGQWRPPTRFAPIRDRAGQVVPYLYAGSTLECAIFETVFHNVPIDATDKFVDLDDHAQRAHAELCPQRDLTLVDLSTDGLHRLRVPKAELIASAPIDYLTTSRWAEALHHQCDQIDGLIWMSRQRDRDRAVLLFGDRVEPVMLSGRPLGGPLRYNTALRQVVLSLALRAGIDAA
jgi:hypothetical protein